MLLVLLLAVAGLARAADFNSSITVTLDAWSPMLSFWGAYKINDNGTAQRDPDSTADTWINWYFVGTDYKTKGTLRPGPNSTESALARNQQLGTDPLRTIYLGPSEGNSTGLGSISGLPLGAYTISFLPMGNTRVTFESLSYSVPVLTQAPSFETMQSQTHRAIASVNGSNELSRGFSAHPRRSQKYLEQARSMSPWDIPPNATWSNSQNGALLDKATELTYEVPANTTLVNVTAAVGLGGECYAVLEPMPDWWNLKSVPMVSQNKGSVRPDEQTMFVLPTDPTVKYNLTIGPFGNTTQCHVGGVTSYSFFYEAPPGTAESLNTTEAAGGTADPTNAESSAQNTTSSKKTNVGAIVGGVVGGVCGLLLLLLALWLLLRRRRNGRDRANDETPNGHPTVSAYTPPTTVSTQNSFVKGSPFSSSDSPPLPDAAAPISTRAGRDLRDGSGAPEVEYAQDYEDVSNPPGRLVLPPRYREAWGGRDTAEVSPEEDHEEAPILRDTSGRANQLKRDLISVVDAKRDMSTA